MTTGRPRATKAKRRPERSPAPVQPIARVAVDTPLPHLDRPFDYVVDADAADLALPGCRVRIRFAGKLVDGFVLERTDATEHAGRLSFIDRVVSPEPVLTTEISDLARAVADRWAGTLSDVLRLAVPPRHAAAESSTPTDARLGLAAPGPPPDDLPVDVARLADELRGGAVARTVAAVPPGEWPTSVSALAAATVGGGRSAIILVPDHRDVARVAAALSARLGADGFVALTADLGPAERYRRFLAVRRGHVRCVVGTRSAVWAPVADLGLVVVWDDGDDLYAEPRAPYCHVRDVAVLRAHRAGAACVIAGHAVSVEGAALVTRGWATRADGAEERDRLPAIRATGDAVDGEDPVASAARLPTLAWRTARDALAAGAPVLVQVPRAGYQPALACNRCRRPARCERCAGPLGRGAAAAAPLCRWCGAAATSWRCPDCGETELRAIVVGVRRTAEELGRAFPGATVRMSSGDHVVSTVPDRPVLVVATPGAEPVAAGGYGAALLLDGWSMLTRPDLRAAEETLRRWINAAALVRPAPAGGRVVVGAASELRPVQALLRWRPWWHAERELTDRAALHLPPAARLAAVTGPSQALAGFVAECELPAGAEVLGPVPVPTAGEVEQGRLLIRVPAKSGLALAAALKAVSAMRSARKDPDVVRVALDPVEVG